MNKSIQLVTNIIEAQADIEHNARQLEEIVKEEHRREILLIMLRNAAWKVGAESLGYLIDDLLLSPKPIHLKGGETVTPQHIFETIDNEVLQGLIERAVVEDVTVNMPEKNVE